MGGRPSDHLQDVWVIGHDQSAECPVQEGIAACPGRSCRCGTAADRTPALQVGVTSLHNSCSRGHLTVVQTLLENGADVAARSVVRDVGAVGFTSLHVASENGHLAVVQALLEHGADVAARTEVGAEGGRDWRAAAPMRLCAAVCLCLRGRASPPVEASLAAVAPLLTARLLSSAVTSACTGPALEGTLPWCRRCWSTAPTSQRGMM
jgi:hypothetical protein